MLEKLHRTTKDRLMLAAKGTFVLLSCFLLYQFFELRADQTALLAELSVAEGRADDADRRRATWEELSQQSLRAKEQRLGFFAIELGACREQVTNCTQLLVANTEIAQEAATKLRQMREVSQTIYARMKTLEEQLVACMQLRIPKSLTSSVLNPDESQQEKEIIDNNDLLSDVEMNLVDVDDANAKLSTMAGTELTENENEMLFHTISTENQASSVEEIPITYSYSDF